MSGSQELVEGEGSECNRVRIGGETVLLGDPKVRPEKPLTIVRFPGGYVEIARTSCGRYWAHVAVHGDHENAPGRIIDARIDFSGRYGREPNEDLKAEVDRGDVQHVAFLIEQGEER